MGIRALRRGCDASRLRAAAGGATLLAAALVQAAAPAPSDLVRVIVRPRVAPALARDAVADRGGTILGRYDAIGAFSARVPRSAIASLARLGHVTPDARLRFAHTVDGFDAKSDAGSAYNVGRAVGARTFWKAGHTGEGIDVALIDSGVVPVEGLTGPGKVLNGPDLSFESQAPEVRYLDTFGHGTHMAGVIAGRDPGLGDDELANEHDAYVGIAPGARLVSLKVGAANGTVDVSQVIAAIDWVVTHRNDGVRIRVLNLSFGTDGAQRAALDPLAYAAEVAWRKGIVVVVSAGNRGSTLGRLDLPAADPFVIAVGASDSLGTAATSDDVVADWSSRGDGTRNPDLVAPGRSIAGLRDPGSHIDVTYPAGRVNERLFRASGTSASAAVVSGTAALLLSQRPSLSPDQVKAILVRSARPIEGAPSVAQGAGALDLERAYGTATPASAQQAWGAGSGSGTLEGSRGSIHIQSDGVELRGEQDIFGEAWRGARWARDAWDERSWSGGSWNGSTWSGSSWSGSSWSGSSWSGSSWSGSSWSGSSWSGSSWSGSSWSGSSWSGSSWSGSSWSGSSWSGSSWSGSSWSTAAWG